MYAYRKIFLKKKPRKLRVHEGNNRVQHPYNFEILEDFHCALKSSETK